MSDASPLLIEARGLSSGYGPIPVIRGLNLTVAKGEVVALLGPNGAGKTTTLLTLAGVLRPSSGELLVGGSPTRAALHRRARAGLALVTEERSVFMRMSTADNLRVAGCDTDAALELFPELRARWRTKAGSLSGGEQQMLALARALSRHPSLLLADELSLGLAPLAVDRLHQAVRKVATERGVGAVLVEQQINKVLKFADRIYVMRRGEVVLEGAAADYRDRTDAIEASYLSASSVGSE